MNSIFSFSGCMKFSRNSKIHKIGNFKLKSETLKKSNFQKKMYNKILIWRLKVSKILNIGSQSYESLFLEHFHCFSRSIWILSHLSKKIQNFVFRIFRNKVWNQSNCDLPLHDLVNLSNKLLLKLIWNCTE